MKIFNEIMDAMGIIDEVEEEDTPRKPREEKKNNRFAKQEVKQEDADLDDEDDVEEEMSTKEKITSLFTRKKSVVEAEAAKTPAESVADEKVEPTKRRLTFAFNKKDGAEANTTPAETRPVTPAKPIPRRAPFPTALGEVNMQMLEPVSFDDSQKVADALHNSQPVVVNFENTDPVIAKRMTDFISGVIYALQGNMKKIGRNILICAPKNVDIDSGLGSEYRGEDSWK